MAKRADKAAKLQPVKAQKPRRWLRRLIRAFLIVILILAISPFAMIGATSIGRMHSVDNVDPHDVAIVYGAGLYGDRPAPYLAARLELARQLFEAGKVKVILVSGDNLHLYHNEPKVMREWLVENGVPANKIVADYAGADTYSTCVRASQIFGVTSAILVSQTYHLHRAVATCRMIGLDAVGVGDDSVRTISDSWKRYQAREILADYKMVLDVLTNRQPILGPKLPDIDDALGR